MQEAVHPDARSCKEAENTIEELSGRYLEPVFHYVLRRTHQREDAEDLTFEVFAEAISAWSRFRGDSSPYVWLLGIARRKLIRRARVSRIRRESLQAELDVFHSTVEGPEAALERSERRRVILELLDSLREEQREALFLQYMEELSIKEIAMVMRRSPAAVNSLLQRARAAMFHRGRDYFEESIRRGGPLCRARGGSHEARHPDE